MPVAEAGQPLFILLCTLYVRVWHGPRIGPHLVNVSTRVQSRSLRHGGHLVCMAYEYYMMIILIYLVPRSSLQSVEETTLRK